MSWEETPEPKKTLESLIRLWVKSVRITGGKGLGDKAEFNVVALKNYRKIVKGKIALVLASGVKADNFLHKMMVETNIRNAHVGSGVRTPEDSCGKIEVEKIRGIKTIHDKASIDNQSI